MFIVFYTHFEHLVATKGLLYLDLEWKVNKGLLYLETWGD